MPNLAQNLSFILLGEDRTASKTMTGAAATADKVTARIGTAFQKVGGIIGGEFGGVLSKVGDGIDSMGSKAAKFSTALTISGGVAVGAGIGLQQFGSAATQATDQLNAAIASTGSATTDYTERIDKAVKAGENFDHKAVDTKGALTILTEATGDTGKALDKMQVVTDLAAAKHISLSEAAALVAKILSGSGARTLTQYGIVMQKAVDPTKALAAAHALVQTSSDKLAAAQKRLTDLEEVDHAKKKLTVADHIALQNAQDAVTKASGVLDAAQTKLNNTSDKTTTKQQAGAAALDQLAKKLNGQGTASVNNFGSQVDIAKTKISDFAEEIAGPVGQGLTAFGGAATAVGLVLDIVKAKQAAAAAAALAQSVATDAAAASEVGLTVETVALNGAMDANPIGAVAGALGVLAGLVGGGILLSGTNNLTQATKDYVGALQGENDQLQKNLENVARKALLDDGSLAAAQKLGIDGATVVQAALGNAAAQRTLNAALDEQSKKLLAAKQDLSDYGTATSGMSASQIATESAIATLSGSVNDQSGALKAARTQVDLLSGSYATLAQKQAAASGSRYAGQAAAYANRPTHAAGGDIMHNETALVGENGPEVVALPGGSHVYPTGQGPNSSGGGGNIYITVNAGAVGNESFLAKTVLSAVTNAARSGQIPKNGFSTALTGH